MPTRRGRSYVRGVDRSAGRAEDVLRYWFGEADHAAPTPEALGAQLRLWFAQSSATDAFVRAEFGAELDAASSGGLGEWARSPRGRLALIVVCDQFPRNVHRDSPLAFAMDARAVGLTEEGLARGEDASLNVAHRIAFYMPLMHAEDMRRQERSLALYARLHDDAPPVLRPAFAKVYEAAERHHRIVRLFGRYPHRNAVLGRATTPEESEFLSGPDASFEPASERRVIRTSSRDV